jgi:hypothetical protein
MGGFRDAKIGDRASKYILKMEVGKTYLIKIVEDVLHQWTEMWPVFVNAGGNKIKRRFVASEDSSNIASLLQFKKDHDIRKMLPEDELNNWNPSNQNAVLVIVGTEQTVKQNGKVVRKIMWDKKAQIWVFGYTILRQLDGLNHNPELIERADAALEKAASKIRMATDPDDTSDGGYLVTDVYAIRITKTKKGKKIDYDTQADKLTGKMKDIEGLEVVSKELTEHTKPSPIAQVEAFLADNWEGHSAGKSSSEPEAVEEVMEEAPPVEEEGIVEEAPIEEAVVEEGIVEEDPPVEELDAEGLVEEIEVPAEEEEMPKPVTRKPAAAPAPVRRTVVKR